jgi:hypothetical protein
MKEITYEIICFITSISGILLSYNKLDKTPYNVMFLSAGISFLLRGYRLIINKPGETIDHPLQWADIATAVFAYLIVYLNCPNNIKYWCILSFLLMSMSMAAWPIYPRFGEYPHIAAHILNVGILLSMSI